MIKLKDILLGEQSNANNKAIITRIVQSYTMIEDPSNPGKMVKGTPDQAKDYYNYFIKTNKPNPPSFEKFQIIWNRLKADGKLDEALPTVPMSTGFKPTETYHREIPEQFLRFYNNDGGNKKGRFIDMAEQLVKTYDDPRIQQSLEQIDDVAMETQELLAPESNRDLGHNVKSPQDKNINAAVWKYLDDIHETVNSIINNSTFDGWPVETTAAELQGLYDDLEELKNMYSSNYGPAPDQKAIGF